LYKSNMWLNHKFCAMVACHLNFQFQVFVLLKGTKELGVIHYTVDLAIYQRHSFDLKWEKWWSIKNLLKIKFKNTLLIGLLRKKNNQQKSTWAMKRTYNRWKLISILNMSSMFNWTLNCWKSSRIPLLGFIWKAYHSN